MNNPDYFNLPVSPQKLRVRGAFWLRTVIVVAFIGVIALFFTTPVQERPLPMPAGVDSSATVQK